MEGGSGSSACTTGVTNANSVTLTLYSSPRSGDTTTLGSKGPVKLKNLSPRAPLVLRTTFAPLGSVSLDSQSSTTPYESSSLATPQAGVQ